MSEICFNVVSSGSRGNSTIVCDDEDKIVIDFGISVKRFNSRLEELGKDRKNISVILTHEHGDHSSGLLYAHRRLGADIYLREKVKTVMKAHYAYSMGDKIAIGNFSITALPVSHDATDPVGFLIENKNFKMCIFSDLGFFNESYFPLLKNCNIIAVESNHDVELLKNGPYPEHLKKRIQSNYGHLSNEQAARAISNISNVDSRIVLLHLSDENNRHDLAISTTRDYLSNRGIPFRSIEAARQLVGSQTYYLH
ncbi:MBL fold metallo-hydrolase [Caldiplasma sukawensis]